MAAGLSLPAFRAIIKDVKRYSHLGYNFIPTLEYHQMCLPYDEEIITNQGSIPIGQIMENNLNCKVLTYNFEKNKCLFCVLKASLLLRLVSICQAKNFHVSKLLPIAL